MGSMVIVGDKAELYSLGKIVIGDGTMISQEAYLCAGTHDYSDVSLPLVTLPIEIGAEAWICARAFVCPGVKVGTGAVVGACGVVVKDVEPWTVVGGNPAKFIKNRELH
jgi:putative colanic acid biosynthesis acetyltransferase WcaF